MFIYPTYFRTQSGEKDQRGRTPLFKNRCLFIRGRYLILSQNLQFYTGITECITLVLDRPICTYLMTLLGHVDLLSMAT